jgi:ABC-2 type transport system permease protein
MKYYLFSNVDLQQYFDGSPLVKGTSLTFSISILLIYFIAMNVISFAVFKKRDIAV